MARDAQLLAIIRDDSAGESPMVGNGVNGFGSQGAKEVAANDEGTTAPDSWPGNWRVAVAADFDGTAKLAYEKTPARRAGRIVRAFNEFVSVIVCE